MTDLLKRGVQFFSITALLAACAGIWIVSAIANYQYGLQISAGSEYSYVVSGASVFGDMLKAGMVFCLVQAVMDRKVVSAIASFALIIVTLIWSIQSSTGFMTSMLVSSTATGENIQNANTSRKAEMDQLLANLTAARKRSVQARHRQQRADAKASIQSMQARLDWMRGTVAKSDVAATGNPLLKGLSEILRFDSGTITQGRVFSFVLLLDAGSFFAFVALSSIMTAKWTPSPVSPAIRVADEGNPGLIESDPDLVAELARGSNIIIPPQFKQTAAPDDEISRAVQARKFLNYLLSRNNGGTEMLVKDVWATYEVWTNTLGARRMNKTQLSSYLRRLGVTPGNRSRSGRSYFIPTAVAA